MYAGDNVDLLYVLEPYGWSTCILYVDGKAYPIGITHIFEDTVRELIAATVALLEGAPVAEFLWRDEPGVTRWRMTRNAEQHHKIAIFLSQSARDGLLVKQKPLVSFEIKLSQFSALVYHQMAKLEVLLKERSFREHRPEFPIQEFHRLRTLCRWGDQTACTMQANPAILGPASMDQFQDRLSDSLEAQFLALADGERRRIHFSLCERALRTWREYCQQRKHIAYIDSVVGLQHELDLRLPEAALESAGRGTNVTDVAERYQEPITALQNGDLLFPEAVEYAFYSLYNLFRRYALGEAVDDWLLVNQALSSIADEKQWESLLRNSIQGGL